MIVKSYPFLVEGQTQSTFNDGFWENQDIIIDASDNTKTKRFVDERWVWYRKAMLATGIFGLKASLQVVIPFLTQWYGDLSEEPEISYPYQIIDYYPYKILHTIEWGKRQFSNHFNENCNNVISYFTNPTEFVSKLSSKYYYKGRINIFNSIKNMLEIKKENSFEACVKFAWHLFNQIFTVKIKDMIKSLPKDYVNSVTVVFFNVPLRGLTPTELDLNNQLHLQFISAWANLIAFNIGIPQNRNTDEIIEMASKIELPIYESKSQSELSSEENK